MVLDDMDQSVQVFIRAPLCFREQTDPLVDVNGSQIREDRYKSVSHQSLRRYRSTVQSEYRGVLPNR